MRTDVSGWDYTDLVEHLQQSYGIGVDDGKMPYYKWRAREAVIVKNLCQSRHVDIATVVRCAEYCKAANKNAETVTQVLSHLHDAAVWDKAQQRDELEEEIRRAIEREQALADKASEVWIGKLLRAAPERKREVLAEWQTARR